jgi:hypothetical protein
MDTPSSREPQIGKRLVHLPANKAILLDNCICAYCGTDINKQTRTKEHVVGRLFVPKGKFNNQWNLILWVCGPCNNYKAELENDLSAITMQPDAAGRYAQNDPALHSEAQRKAKNATNRRTKKLVKDSIEKMKVEVPLGPGATATFSFIAPPQPDQHRIFDLARLQLLAFFYFITFNRDTKRGWWWPGEYLPVMQTPRGDWGNVVHRAFMDRVLTWEPRFLGSSADGYFKIVIRRHPGADCWSWALEWNHQYRIIGFLGDRAAAEAVHSTFPPLPLKTLPQGSGQYLRSRMEVPLEETADKMFTYDEPSGTENTPGNS